MEKPVSENQVTKFITWLTDQSIAGIPPLVSAEKLAREYLNDKKYKNNDDRVDRLITWETTKNFTTGFITGLGGLLTLPVSIPGALAASWIIQARLCATIAIIYGHDTHEERVQTMILMCLLGDAGKEVIKQFGIKVGTQLTKNIIKAIPGKILIQINKQVGFRLLTKAGQKGALNFMKIVPIVGGPISGTIDAAACFTAGKIAKNLFKPDSSESSGKVYSAV